MPAAPPLAPLIVALLTERSHEVMVNGTSYVLAVVRHKGQRKCHNFLVGFLRTFLGHRKCHCSLRVSKSLLRTSKNLFGRTEMLSVPKVYGDWGMSRKGCQGEAPGGYVEADYQINKN